MWWGESWWGFVSATYHLWPSCSLGSCPPWRFLGSSLSSVFPADPRASSVKGLQGFHVRPSLHLDLDFCKIVAGIFPARLGLPGSQPVSQCSPDGPVQPCFQAASFPLASALYWLNRGHDAIAYWVLLPYGRSDAPPGFLPPGWKESLCVLNTCVSGSH